MKPHYYAILIYYPASKAVHGIKCTHMIYRAGEVVFSSKLSASCPYWDYAARLALGNTVSTHSLLGTTTRILSYSCLFLQPFVFLNFICIASFFCCPL